MRNNRNFWAAKLLPTRTKRTNFISRKSFKRTIFWDKKSFTFPRFANPAAMSAGCAGETRARGPTLNAIFSLFAVQVLLLYRIYHQISVDNLFMRYFFHFHFNSPSLCLPLCVTSSSSATWETCLLKKSQPYLRKMSLENCYEKYFHAFVSFNLPSALRSKREESERERKL